MRTKNLLVKILAGLLLLIIINNCFADQNSYNEGIRLATQKKQGTQDALKNFNQREFSGFTNNPQESSYYGDATQKHDNLAQATQEATSKSIAAKAIIASFPQRPVYKIDKNEAGIKKSQTIINDAPSIARGISTKDADCKEATQKSCKEDYYQDVCNEAGRLQKPTCTKSLIVAVEKPLIEKIVTVEAEARRRGEDPVITVDLKTGVITKSNAPYYKANVTPTLTDTEGNELSVKYLGAVKGRNFVIMQHPDSSNGFKITFWFNGKGMLGMRGGYALVRYQVLTYQKPIVTEHWQSNCTWLENFATQKSCKLENEVCSQGKTTRTINGERVTRDCWEKTYIYNCGNSNTSDGCKPLRDKGCEQIGSQCMKKQGDMCLEYQQTFQCSSKKCIDQKGIVCGGKFFCIDGDCSSHNYAPNKDFEKSISTLSAMGAAQKDFDEQFIFKGHRATCDNTILGFNNCCRDSGWGQDIHLASCSAEEKKLGNDKEKGLTIYIGEYCSSDFLGVCLEHRKTYCSFGSKLARIVQTQGRSGQLRIGFGDAENTNCRGLTPEEMQKIDFSKVDFSEFYADLNTKMKMPNIDETNKRISDRVKEQYGARN